MRHLGNPHMRAVAWSSIAQLDRQAESARVVWKRNGKFAVRQGKLPTSKLPPETPNHAKRDLGHCDANEPTKARRLIPNRDVETAAHEILLAIYDASVGVELD